MEGKLKLFMFFGFFKLPDEFDGNLSDALREVAKYHDLKQGSEKFMAEDDPRFKGPYGDHGLYDFPPIKEMWVEFLRGLNEEKLLTAFVTISEYKNDEPIQKPI